MKLFLALVGGFAATLTVFAAGAVLATVYFTTPAHERGAPTDTAVAWSNEPVRVAYADDAPPASAEPQPTRTAAADDATETDEGGLDLMTTAAVAAEAPPEQKKQQEQRDARDAEIMMMRTAHDEWCSSQFRSYRAEDNSYQPYHGPREPCVSPYLAELEALTGPDAGAGQAVQAEGTQMVSFEAVDADSGMQYTVVEPEDQFGPARMTRDHIQSCFDRYRSYRPEDNSYQPYGGGPRRQCR